MIDFEFYETAEPFTRFLFSYMAHHVKPMVGRICEPCVGDHAIVRAAALRPKEFGISNHWWTNDLDERWPADCHLDATKDTLWLAHEFDWTVTNPPFSSAVPILQHALRWSKAGVAMYLRASINEPLKVGERRRFFAQHRPTVTLWLPRFAHQRSKTKGIWSADSMTSCWLVWLKDWQGFMGTAAGQIVDYAPESVLDELEAFTPSYRERMDALMGYTGSEKDRQEQCKARWIGIAA